MTRAEGKRKKIALCLLGAALLSACSGGMGSTPTANAPGFLRAGPITLIGKISNYDASNNGTTLYSSISSDTDVQTATISADGSFAITSPVPTSGLPLQDAFTGCPTGATQVSAMFTTTPEDATYRLLRLSTDSSLNSYLVLKDPNATTLPIAFILYAFKDATKTGPLLCTAKDGAQVTYTYNLQFQKGWNSFEYDLPNSDSTHRVYTVMTKQVADSLNYYEGN